MEDCASDFVFLHCPMLFLWLLVYRLLPYISNPWSRQCTTITSYMCPIISTASRGLAQMSLNEVSAWHPRLDAFEEDFSSPAPSLSSFCVSITNPSA